ncbi:hypothetical protein D910_04688 [Dendroctonus ponderosae]|uniref:DUF4817 domain-containing protein n=1 Tax=Dendroctonus ponderosae TaxID=77166 RepID=U4U4L9_DENPD|nr:hypothetical protein D910_04688 [Dendroctonus ponderosae]
MFTNIEYTDMLLVIGECHSNVAEAVRTYANRFPNRRQPSAHVLRRPIQRARDTGRLAPRIEIESGRPRGARVPDIEELQILPGVHGALRNKLHFPRQMYTGLLPRKGFTLIIYLKHMHFYTPTIH